MFHEDVPDEWIDRVFAVMASAPQHTFQCLTKRAQRMRRYVDDAVGRVISAQDRGADWPGWPLPNVWLGTSTERQQEADERIPELLQTPAAVRFISAEPLLGSVDLHDWCTRDWHPMMPPETTPRIDWVIVGGESGHGARPMHPDWARSLRDQCATAGVAYFFKQWGSFVPIIDRDNDDPDWRRDYTRASHDPDRFKILNLAGGCGFHGDRVHLMQRYSKTHAGRHLDGIEHNARPGRPA